ITRIALVLCLLASTDQFTAGWTKRRLWASVELGLVGIAVAGAPDGAALGGWLAAAAIGGLGFAAISWWVLRLDVPLVAVAFGVIGAIELVATGLGRAFPGAVIYGLIAAVLVLLTAWYWFRVMRRTVPRAGAAGL